MIKRLQEFLYSIKLNSKLKRFFFFFKIFVSLLILYIIFKKINWSNFLATIKEFRYKVIINLFLLETIRIILQIINWKNSLKISNINVPFSLVLKTYFLGSAFRFIVPGGHGIYGTVFYFKNNKLRATVAITLKRFFQTWSIFLFSLFGLYFYKFSYSLLIAIFAILAFLPIIIPLIIKKLSIFPVEITLNFKKYYDHYVLWIISFQVMSILIFIFEYYILLSNFVKINFIKVFIGTPMILLAQTIPISYSGLGLSEGFAIKVLNRFEISPDIAVTSSLMIFLVSSLIPGIIGLIIFLKNKKKAVN